MRLGASATSLTDGSSVADAADVVPVVGVLLTVLVMVVVGVGVFVTVAGELEPVEVGVDSAVLGTVAEVVPLVSPAPVGVDTTALVVGDAWIVEVDAVVVGVVKTLVDALLLELCVVPDVLGTVVETV